MNELVVEGFAGCGGWSTGLRMAGYTGRSVGFELDAAACATGQAAGHQRVRADVATFPLAQFVGKVTGAIFSPPCPTFSNTGDGAGKTDLPNVLRLIADFAADREPGDYEWVDERSALTAQPMRWAVALKPRWIALEQVPPVLPIWRYMAELLRGLGYNVWCGVLSAECYGVPQTRKRAILVASLDGPVGPPAPTHQAYRSGKDVEVEPHLFGDPLPPPVSIADALGWTGEGTLRSNYGTGGDPADRGHRDLGQPGPTVTSKVGRNIWMAPAGATSKMVDPRPAPAPAHTITGQGSAAWVLRNGTQDNACTRTPDEPAGVMFFGQRGNAVDWVVRTGNNSHVTGRTGSKAGDGDVQAYERSCGQPAPTLDTMVGSKWTVADKAEPTTVRVSVQEAGILQSFPRGYPWRGTQTQQYRDVGNAVPPLLAAHILAQFIPTAGEVAA